MTLLKQTTATGADDNFSSFEMNDDVQTDCCANSLGALKKKTRALTLSASDDANNSNRSYESGIASFCENSEETLELDSASGREVTFRSDIYKCGVSDKKLYSCVREDDGLNEKEVDKKCKECLQFTGTVQDKHSKKEDKIRARWDEMREDFPDKDGDTALHLAVIQTVTHLWEVVKLLGLEGQVNLRNRLYQTPLHLAALTSNLHALSVLLRLGASLLPQDCNGNTPPHIACQRNDMRTLKTLLEEKCRYGEEKRPNEEREGIEDGERLSSRRSKRNDILGEGDDDDRNNEGECESLVTLTCTEETDIRFGKQDGVHKPSEAEGDSEKDEASFLRDRGQDAQELMLTRQREAVVALRTRNYEGFTCLHLAVLKGSPDLVTLLLRHGADVNAKDGKSGRTALHFAVDSPNPCPVIISTLLQHPDLLINTTNFAHQTALQLARGRCHSDLVDLLHVHGADWLECIHGYPSSDGFSDEEMEEDYRVPYDDICVAGLPVVHSRRR